MNAPTREPAASGDREVFGGLDARHAGQVFGFVVSRVRDQRLAEDLTAETFARALRATQSATAPVADPRAWLDTIALNLVRDHYRRRGAQREITTGDLRDSTAPGQRECIGLRFWQELPVAQAAAVLGCSVGTVKSQTHRAVGKLRAAMTADSPPAPPRRDTTADQVAAARAAVAQVHQLVTGEDYETADADRALELTQAAELVEQRGHDRDALATGGAA